jgi:hypothetical protein
MRSVLKYPPISIAATVCLLLLLMSGGTDAKQPFKERKYKVLKDRRSGRTGHVRDKSQLPLRRMLQTGSTTIVPGMRLCPDATSTVRFILGDLALTASNARFPMGRCDLSSYNGQSGDLSGLQWGLVESWAEGHEFKQLFNNTGETRQPT